MRMQLKPKVARTSSMRQGLMAASCALLGVSGARAQESHAVPTGAALLADWSLDSALAYYREDGRIQAIEPVVNVSKIFAGGETLSLNATFDSLSGSSPNGALTSHTAQTFSSPSGKASHRYTTRPGQLPVDPDYQDDRIAVGANWSMPITRVTEVNVGGKVSAEDDFYSLTIDASVAHDFNEKNTTLSFGLYNEFDSLRPIGGAPAPGSDSALADKTGDKTKDGVGVLLGLTQVVTRSWLSEVNISIDRFKGYLNDPYKFTSVIDSAGGTVGYEYESRPDQRLRKSAYWDNRIAWAPQLSTAVSLRHMSDNWGVRSDTVQGRFHWSMSDRRYIEPSIRWYRQTAADFYTPFILSPNALATVYESSDSRLGPFHAVTFGLKYAQKLPGFGGRGESEFSVRAEYYEQTRDERSPTPTGLEGLNLYPDLKAILIQIGWRF
jgi:Protein of unknown function (DUF3570)